LDLISYWLHEDGVRLFADIAAERSGGTIEVLADRLVIPTRPLKLMSDASALAQYYAPGASNVEPALGLSALPMLAGTFDEAETLLRIARPYYMSALARHGQILLATEPRRPAALWSSFPIRTASDMRDIRFAPFHHPAESAGWRGTFDRLGVRSATFFDAELMLYSGGSEHLKFTQEFSCFIELFFAAQLNFITASQKVFDTLTEAQRRALVEAGRDTEVARWRAARELLLSDHQSIAARGVSVIAKPPADVLEAFRKAAEPDIQSWAYAAGADGTAILAEYRRTIGRE
jgi:TRAP-type C4-dicarboxylate transport system substrate-binding protein